MAIIFLQDKNHRFMALDCLHRAVRFYLSVYAPGQPPNRVWDYLDSVTSQLLTILRKGMLTQDVQHDKLVDFCVTIAENNLDFAMNHMILELLRQDSSSEAKVIGLRALHRIVVSPSSEYVGLEIFQGDYWWRRHYNMHFAFSFCYVDQFSTSSIFYSSTISFLRMLYITLTFLLLIC